MAGMKRRRRWGMALAALLLLLVGMPLALKFFSATPGAESGVMSAADPSPPRPEVSVEEVAGLTVIRDTEFDRVYGSASSTASDDLKALDGILGDAMLLLKDFDRRPLADNADFVAVLQGNNPHQVAWIRPGHPLVSEAGELLDRWGQPVFFHRESSERTTLRSAGPDQVMWTDDDVVFGEAE